MYAFDYQRPADTTAALAAFGQGDARFLAGGQSLVQAMKLRLASAERLVDLGGIEGLRGIERTGNTVTIGAMTTHATVAASAEVRQAIPGLAELAGSIGDPMVRNRGTIGGSLANNDPAADYPAGALGLGATINVASVSGTRAIPADDFFKGLYETALQPGELITSVSFPVPQRSAYIKFKQPASRFALVGVFVSQGAGGVRVAVTGAGPCVFRVPEMEAALAANFAPEAVKGIRIPAEGLNTDLHATAEYRAAMVTVMAARAVAAALAR